MSMGPRIHLYMQNSVPSIRITSLYWSQPSSVVLCIQNSDFMTTIACVYGSQNSPVVFYMQNSVPSTWITGLYVSPPSSVGFLFAKQRIVDPNNKSLRVPDMTCHLVRAKQHA